MRVKEHDNAVKTFGYGYLVGDAALMTAGVLKATHDAKILGVPMTSTQRFKEAAAGGIYATAGIIGARYGDPSTEKKLELLYSDMHHDLMRMGIQIPKDATPELLASKDGVIDHIEAFLYRHPTQMIHAIFAAGGVQNMLAGLPKGQTKFNKDVFASGLLITIGGLVGLMLPEKKPDPAHPPEGFVNKLVAKAQEKPLATAAAIFTVNNAFLLTGTYADKKAFATSTTGAQHAWMFKLATAAAYITSNYFLSRSKRENTGSHGAEQDEIIQKLQETSARLVLAQRPEMQEAVLQQVSGYLATRPEVGETAEQIATELHQTMQRLAPIAQAKTDKSWVQRSGESIAMSENPTR